MSVSAIEQNFKEIQGIQLSHSGCCVLLDICLRKRRSVTSKWLPTCQDSIINTLMLKEIMYFLR